MLVNISICGSSVGQLKIIFINYLAHVKGIKDGFLTVFYLIKIRLRN